MDRLSFLLIAKVLLILVFFFGYSESMITSRKSTKPPKSQPEENTISAYNGKDEAYEQTYDFQKTNRRDMALANILPSNPKNWLKKKSSIRFDVYST